MYKKSVDDFWNEYLVWAKKPPDTEYIDCYHYGYNEELAESLLSLVLSGKKTAASSSFLAYKQGEPLPQVGDLSIITDWQGNPRCVIENTAVTIIPFNEMTYDVCSREGEDKTVESWQENHRTAFTLGGEEEGYTFTEDMPVVFEDFRVVYGIVDVVINKD